MQSLSVSSIVVIYSKLLYNTGMENLDFLKLASERFSVRKFTTEKVEDELLKKIIHAGYVAPTACNLQPQRVLVINTMEGMEKLKKCTKFTFDAPTAIVICYNKDECWLRKYDNKTSGEIDASIVTTHMMLETQDLGLGSTWVMMFHPELVCQEFNLPENIVPVSILMMGHPATDAKPFPGHVEFRPLEDLIKYETF